MGTDSIVTFTEEALEVLKEKLPEMGGKDLLRLGVVGGGCSGYQYLMDVQKEEDKRPDDVELKFDWLTVYIDPISAGYLEGTKIEYIVSLNQEGFNFNNPNAKRTCGCGKSFS